MNKFYNYLKYSGACVTITVNPFHWAWIPVFSFEKSEEIWYQDSFRFSFLLLTIRFWIDDGNW